MKTIYKYPIPYGSTDTYTEMPNGARILAVQMQNGKPYVWAIVETTMEVVGRRFVLYGTGHALDDYYGTYIGTFQDGPFVWHLFERI
jgi:hypothetical protein